VICLIGWGLGGGDGSNSPTPTFVPALFANIPRFNCSQSEEINEVSYNIADFTHKSTNQIEEALALECLGVNTGWWYLAA